MSKTELIKYLLDINYDISIKIILMSMICSLLLSSLMYFIYKKTYSGVVYSKNFNTTLIMISLITTLVMMVIGNNLALSLGMVGSLSIIRFRSAVKEPRDIVFIFWAIAIGLASGAEMYVVDLVGTVFIACVVLFFSNVMHENDCYVLVVRGGEYSEAELENTLKKITKKMKIQMSTNSDGYIENTYEISINREQRTGLISEVNKIKGVDTINLVSYRGEMLG